MVAVAARGRCLLGRAGLAAGIEALDQGRAAGAMVLLDDLAHHVLDRARHIGVEDPIGLFVRLAVGGRIEHELEGLVDPVVGQGEKGLGELHRGDGNTLAKGGGGQIEDGPSLGRAHEALALAGDGQAGRVAETKFFEIGMEPWRTELQADLGRTDVARKTHDLVDRQRTVGVGVLDDLAGQGEFAVFAVVDGFRPGGVFLEGGGHEQRFHGRAGLEHVQGGPVAGQPGADAAPGVGVEKGIVGHGQDLARGHMDHQGHPGLGIVAGHGLFELFLGEKLDLGVDGQVHVLAVDVGQFLALGVVEEPPARGVALDHEPGLAAA